MNKKFLVTPCLTDGGTGANQYYVRKENLEEVIDSLLEDSSYYESSISVISPSLDGKKATVITELGTLNYTIEEVK